MFYKIIKDRVLERTKVLDNLKIYIIERRYLNIGQVSLLVCSNYNRLTKTYSIGYKFSDPDSAYDYYNHCVINKKLIEIEDNEVHDSISKRLD